MDPRTRLTSTTLTVDGEQFHVKERAGSPATYDFTWLTGPNPDYGFTCALHGATHMTVPELEESIRDFLRQVDPDTGYIEEE
ncbi:hypothetical protein [Streptomyces sp. 8N706]|uniref:hypothetical protein n=1 Tax=Streptomyces sp. 8N706 TaxID=3457416 RepID=UPI003FD60514